MGLMAKILVTPRSVTREGGHPSLDKLREAGHEVVLSPAGRQPTEEELMQLLPGCAGYLAGVEPITAAVLQAAPDLRVISRNGTGVDNVDLEAAAKAGVAVARAAGANARGVAELALGLLFSLARGIPANDAALKTGEWKRSRGVELEGRQLGVVGCGIIGKLVAAMGSALGMRVRGYDVVEDPSHGIPGFEYAPLEDVIAQSDFLSLHCPHQAGHAPLLDEAAFARMKGGAYVINTARAGLIDLDAAKRALAEGRLAGLALDVFEEEPPRDTEILGMPGVIASPHVGGFTDESVDRAMDAAVNNLLAELG